MKKIILIILLLLAVMAGGVAFYLYQDEPHREIDISAYQKTFSSDIPTVSTIQFAPVQDSAGLPKNIGTNGHRFVDKLGREMFLRGINLGGSTKVPYHPYTPSHVEDGFFDGKSISFVGRPFPLEEADEHFLRLQKWGFHFLRFLITWEAIEHEGPGIYDEAYIEYVYQIVKKAGEYGINVFIDPHQDVWSRYSGGDGAPLWTFELAGLDVTKFQETGAALVHNTYGDPFPKMMWASNYSKLATATMFTLFFGGNDFAPKLMVHDSIPIQNFLQNHYINAVKQVAQKLKGLPNVIGFDTLNEPSVGFIGRNLNGKGAFPIGDIITPFKAMQLGSGITLEIPYNKPGEFDEDPDNVKLVNEAKESVWLAGKEPVWRNHGVWDVAENGEAVPLQPGYFQVVGERQVDFSEDYFLPFAQLYADSIRSIHPEWMIFIEPALMTPLPVLTEADSLIFVNASHWYDAITLFTKKYIPWLGLDIVGQQLVFGKKKVRETYEAQLANIKHETREALGNAPTLIGEFGIPYDMNEGEAYEDGDFSAQSQAIDRSFLAMERNLLNYTLWNYTADNTNERGDQWNQEDLSIFSRDQQFDPEDIDSGGRALEAVVRPYPYKVAGEIVAYQFNFEEKEFYLKYMPDPDMEVPTMVFLPEFHYADGFKVYAQGGRFEFDEGNDMLLFYPEGDKGMEELVIRGLSD